MNIDQMFYVIEVVRCKSISEAANRLLISQSALSQAITKLEKELGLKLFKRTRSGTLPTDEGKNIIHKIFEITRITEEIRMDAAFRSKNISGELRVATITSEMMTLVKVIADLNKEHANINIEVTEKASFDILNDIRQHKSDIGFVALPESLLEELDGVSFEPLFKGKLNVIARNNSSFSNRKTISPEELRNYPLVLYKDEHIERFLQSFTEQYGSLRILFKTNYEGALRNALTEGLAINVGHGYSYYSTLINQNEFVMLEIESFEQEWIHYGWIWPTSKPLSSIYEYVIQQFKHQATFGNFKRE